MQPVTDGYLMAGDYPLHYLQAGNGPGLLLAFHGYANDAGLMMCFAPLLGRNYTLLSVDLPHHGKSLEWPDGKHFEKQELAALVQEVCTVFGREKISLMGYSLGGRVCLNIAELVPEKIAQIVLIASDGLRPNPFYYFLTRTAWGQHVFRSFRDHPQRYLRLVNRLRDLKWIDASRHKFVMHYMETGASRDFLYKVWSAMSHLLPDRKRVKKQVRQYHIRLDIFMGTYDRVIPVRYASGFLKDLPEGRLHVVDKGHRLFDTDTLQQIAASLQTPS